MITPSPLGHNPLGMLIIGGPGFTVESTPIEPTPTQPPEADFDRSIDYYADYSGCGHWRMIWPGNLLNANQKAVIHGSTMMCLDERYYANTCSVRLQRQATDTQLRFVRLLKEFRKQHNLSLIHI